MQQQMRYEAEYFDDKKRLLRAIFNETLAQCNDAFHRKNISKDKLQEMSLKCDDERYIRNMLDNPISIVLMGNRPCVKARIVNYMLGYELLPVFDSYDPDYNQSRRAVRIQYGTQRRHAFCIKHFELLECSPLHTERVVSFEDLRLDIQNDMIGGVGANLANGLAEGFNNLNLINAALEHNNPGLNEAIGGGSNTSSGLDSAGNDQSTTPTTLSLNSSCSLLKSAPFQTVANGPISNVPNGSRMTNGVGSGTGNQRIQSTNGNTIGNNNHRHCHSSGYSSQQNMTNAVTAAVNHNAVVNPVSATSGTGVSAASNVVNRGPNNNSTINSFLPPYNDDDEEDDDDDDYEMDEVLSQTDFVNEITTMEIILPHELLEKNLQIRVAPDVESFDLIYRTTFTRTSPIIIYCFERNDDRLTDTDQRHLAQLRQRMPSTPIFFAHIMDFEPIYNPCNGQYVQYQYHQTHQNNGSSQAPFLPLPYPYGNTYRLSVDLPMAPSRITAKFSSKQTTTVMTAANNPNEQATTNITAIIANNVDIIADKQVVGSPEFSINQPIIVTDDNGPIDASQTANNDENISMLKRSSSCSSCYSALSLSSAIATRKSYLEASEAIWKELKSLGFFSEMRSTLALQGPLDRRQKHQSNGYYMINERPFKFATKSNTNNGETGMDVASRFICYSYEFCYFVDFFRSILKSNLVVASTLLNEIHNQYIQHYIFSAFEMTWNLNYCVPKRLEYARSKEAELYMSLMGIANRKQDEIRQLIGETLHFIRDDILEQAANYKFNNNQFNCNPIVSAQELKQCAEEIQDFVFVTLNRAIAIKLISSVDVMRESFIGTLERCLKQLEEYRQRKDLGGGSPASRFQNRFTMNDEHKMVNKINQRFQEEKIDFALSRLLNLAYSIDINANTCNSMLRLFWERMKNFFLMFSVTWKPTCRIDPDWKRKVSEDLLDNLSEAKLAKCICTQFREKLKLAHETFLNSLANLENIIISRLKDMDNRRQQVRKNDAPIFARLALESTSLIDAILYGTPELGKEIGRGQYGVVFSTKKSWGCYSRFAVKSIMICDDKHWNDLAMEFYYTRSLPENDRIVQIRGSIIEHNYNGASSYVYLIMDRMVRDLYAGLKAGLEWLQRLQIALDVVQGLRFLHNHGLIHRDIKLKNVLLDKYCRAKITDLGFCKSEVMISGSIVGTPIHMAPEVFTGKYDSMVDVYAFGILFWYICAGSVELPQIFEQCHNKDHLWIVVKKGLRPEKLDIFEDDCFQLMENCWAGESTKRPLLGEVSEILTSIKSRFEKKDSTNTTSLNDTNNNIGDNELKVSNNNSKRSTIVPITKKKSNTNGTKTLLPVPIVTNDNNNCSIITKPETDLTDRPIETELAPLAPINLPASSSRVATATV